MWREHCRLLARSLPVPPGPGPVLDLGVGPGISAFGLGDVYPGVSCVGVDLSHSMLQTARRLSPGEAVRLHLVRTDALALPFPRGAFGGLIAHSFLYLTADRRRVAREAARVLAPGAPFALLEPRDGGRLLTALRPHLGTPRFLLSMILWRLVSGRCGRWQEAELRGCLEQGGLQVESLEPTLGGLGWLVRGRKG